MRPVPAKKRLSRWHPRKPRSSLPSCGTPGWVRRWLRSRLHGSSSALAREEGAQLAVSAPAAGVVATSDPESLLNRDVTTGETLLTIVDPSQLVARLYIPVIGNGSYPGWAIPYPCSFLLVSPKSGRDWERSKVQLCPCPLVFSPSRSTRALRYRPSTPRVCRLGRLEDGMQPGMSGQAKDLRQAPQSRQPDRDEPRQSCCTPTSGKTSGPRPAALRSRAHNFFKQGCSSPCRATSVSP